MDATLKETNVWRSIKKFFVDGLNGTDITPFFERPFVRSSSNAPNKWVTILVENIVPHHVTDGNLTVFCFSKQDNEGDELVYIRDEIVSLLYPGHINLYDTSKDPWVKIGGMKVFITGESNNTYNPDQSKMVYIQAVLKWGAVWS